MPRRSTPTGKPEGPSLLRRPHQEAERLIVEQITKGKEIAARFDERAADRWHDENRTIIERLFTGPEAIEYRNSAWGFHLGDAPPQKYHEAHLDWLESLHGRLKHYELAPEARGAVRPDRPEASPRTREVFVIHGHDNAAKQEVARTLEHLGLVPIILHEQADKGRFILEKFEEHADVGYAVALLTPDDPSGDQRRARQNVVLELGYFLGRLGRGHVRALYKPGVELPSDLHGWLYTEMDAAGAWKLLLARELRAAGFDVDLNRLA